MKIWLTMTRDEIDSASLAIGNFLDNEHDKGADEGCASSWAETAAATLGDAIPGVVVFDIIELATICEACGCYDVYVNDEDASPYEVGAGRLFDRLNAITLNVA